MFLLVIEREKPRQLYNAGLLCIVYTGRLYGSKDITVARNILFLTIGRGRVVNKYLTFKCIDGPSDKSR